MKYFVAKARNLVTGQTVKNQDLTGARFSLNQQSLAQESADQLADKMSARTKEPWVGFIETYTPTQRR